MKPILIPTAIRVAVERGATLAISISGGKDGQAMLNAVMAAYHANGWTGRVFAVHADLGEAEWKESLPHCQWMCERLGVELIVVNRPQGDLLDEIEERERKLAGQNKPAFPDAKNRYCTSDQKRAQIDKELVKAAPPFPSATNRYCTSHQKSNQIDKVLRSPFPSATQRYCTSDQKRDTILKVHREHNLIVSCMGFRESESAARAKRHVVSVQKRITAKALRELTVDEALIQKQPKQRLAIDWLPIFEYSVEDVWEACGTTLQELRRRQFLYRFGWEEKALEGWVGHPAYVYGNERVSCSICILGSLNDIKNGARHNPKALARLRAIEQRSGFTFRQGLSLTDLDPYDQ